MNQVIDFIAKREQKTLTKLQRTVECSFTNFEELDQLVEQQSLRVSDHTLFLGFLVYIQQQELEALDIFRDVFIMKRSQFEFVYNMKWWSVVQLGFTFLSILKVNNRAEYEQFFTGQ